jgi:hypothetical protein
MPPGWVADTAISVALRAFIGDAVNGSTLRILTIERGCLDHSPDDYEFHRAGATYAKTYPWLTATSTSTRATGATDVAAPTYGVLNPSSNVGRVGFNGASITGPDFVMSASFSVNNNLRAQKAIGIMGAICIGNGEITVTGNLQPISETLWSTTRPEHADVLRHAARP